MANPDPAQPSALALFSAISDAGDSHKASPSVATGRPPPVEVATSQPLASPSTGSHAQFPKFISSHPAWIADVALSGSTKEVLSSEQAAEDSRESEIDSSEQVVRAALASTVLGNRYSADLVVFDEALPPNSENADTESTSMDPVAHSGDGVFPVFAPSSAFFRPSIPSTAVAGSMPSGQVQVQVPATPPLMPKPFPQLWPAMSKSSASDICPVTSNVSPTVSWWQGRSSSWSPPPCKPATTTDTPAAIASPTSDQPPAAPAAASPTGDFAPTTSTNSDQTPEQQLPPKASPSPSTQPSGFVPIAPATNILPDTTALLNSDVSKADWSPVLTIPPQQMTRAAAPRLRRVACTCPNCRDGEGKSVMTASGQRRKLHVCHIPGECLKEKKIDR